MTALSDEEVAIIEAIADAEANGEPGLDPSRQSRRPALVRRPLHATAVGPPRCRPHRSQREGKPAVSVQVRIVELTYTGRSALQAARPTRVTIGRVLTPDEQRDIDVFVGLFKAAIGEAQQHRPGPLDGATTEAVAELRADLETLMAQLRSPRPKRSVVASAVLVGVGIVTPSVIGSAAAELATQLSS